MRLIPLREPVLTGSTLKEKRIMKVITTTNLVLETESALDATQAIYDDVTKRMQFVVSAMNRTVPEGKCLELSEVNVECLSTLTFHAKSDALCKGVNETLPVVSIKVNVEDTMTGEVEAVIESKRCVEVVLVNDTLTCDASYIPTHWLKAFYKYFPSKSKAQPLSFD